jgi:hypothetical protein
VRIGVQQVGDGRRIAHRGNGSGPVAVTRRRGTQSSTAVTVEAHALQLADVAQRLAIELHLREVLEQDVVRLEDRGLASPATYSVLPPTGREVGEEVSSRQAVAPGGQWGSKSPISLREPFPPPST